MTLDYFYGAQADQFAFYRIPKALFTDERFKSISAEAKILYGILLDRMSLSRKNGWLDEQGRVFIIFTLEEVMEAIGCADQKATKLLNELDSKAGLIERKRQGLGKPNLIFVKNFVDNSTGSIPPAPESRIKTRENHDSADVNFTTPESRKSRGSNTDSNYIELIAQVEQVLDYIASLPEQERRIINYDAQMTALENEIKRYQDLKINLYSDMADGVISREEYREFHAGYDRRIADRQRQLGKLKDERSQAMENSSGNIEWIEQFKKYRHLTELDRECIVHLIEKILIYDGKRIEVCFRYKDELENALQYIERFEDVLPAEEGVTMPERRNA